MEEQVTAKLKPVFNCSLKNSKDFPSQNEDAYPGVDIINHILQLPFYYLTKKLLVPNDIKQASLIIKIKNEINQTSFFSFKKKGNKLIAYNLKTIVLGFTSSPFTLY